MKATTVYTVNITDYPDGSERWNWEPDGWSDRVMELGWDEDAEFRWPNTNKVYRSRSSAVKLKSLVESYGARAIILTGTIDWKTERQAQIDRLRAKIAELEGEAA
ncbi:hypothetical protein [Timonella senegalensis]|uniref:hypothetical protein n=1 Tax=Timonella senegalensis TaxID=1465825 RepID=UPI0002F785B8|nr:hypothetical protein [Timonella senegalensis]